MKQLAGAGKGSGGESGECNAPHKKGSQQCIAQIIRVVDSVYTGIATCSNSEHAHNVGLVNAKNVMALDAYNKKHAQWSTCYNCSIAA